MSQSGITKDTVRWTLWSVYRSLLCGMLVGMALCEMTSPALVAGVVSAALVPAFVAGLDMRRGKCRTNDQGGDLVFLTYVDMMLVVLGAMAVVDLLPNDFLLNVIVLLIGLLPVAFSWRAHTLVSRSVFGIGARLDARFSKTLPVTPFWTDALRFLDNRAFIMLMSSSVVALVVGELMAVDISPAAGSLAIGMMVAWVVSYASVSTIGREWTINWDKAGREMHTMPVWLD